MVKKILLAVALSGPLSAAAQTYTAPATTPVAGEKGRFAAGIAGGAAFPFGSGYDPGWLVDGSFDWYASRLIAFRGSAGYASSSTELADRYTRASFLGSGVLQFESGVLRPYVRAGVGVYWISPPIGESRARFGVHGGGGVEWFFRPRTSLTGDAVFHLLPSVEDRSASSFDLAFGIRQYF